MLLLFFFSDAQSSCIHALANVHQVMVHKMYPPTFADEMLTFHQQCSMTIDRTGAMGMNGAARAHGVLPSYLKRKSMTIFSKVLIVWLWTDEVRTVIALLLEFSRSIA